MKPLHHVIRKVIHPTIPGLLVPQLILFDCNGEYTTYQPLIDYTVSNSALSITSHLKPVRVMGFLWDALVEAQGIPERDPSVIGRRRFLETFATHLARGTISWTDGKLRDRTGLFWSPLSVDVLNGFGHGFDCFINYMSDPENRDGNDPFSRMFKGLFDIEIPMSSSGRPLKGFGLLAHLNKRETEPAQPGLLDNVAQEDGGRHYLESPTKRFPRELFPVFLDEAFNTRRGIDATGRCFARLLCLGLRSSETLLLWEDDVKIRNGKAVVFLRHPEAFRDRARGGRRRDEVLQRDYKMPPRTKRTDKLKLGWKDPALPKSLSARLEWMDGTEDGAFLVIADYILNARNPIMQQRRARGLPDHPYLLVATKAGKGVEIGDPWSNAASISSFKRAVKRLARLRPKAGVEYGKDYGTTRHAVRHSFGKDAEELGLDDKQIMRMMNHKSILSSRVYRIPDPEEVHQKFEEAKGRRSQLKSPASSVIPQIPMGEALDALYETVIGQRCR